MDFSLFLKDPDKRVRSLVRKLTHTGEIDLDVENLTELRKICGATSKDDLVSAVYSECIKCLRKEHSQVRVSTVKLIDYLFKKSHIFRTRLLEEFDLFLQLSLGIHPDPKKKIKLPPPKKFASLLQELTAKNIHIWHSDFGKGYEKLRYAYKYLREHQLVDFSNFQVRSHEDLINRQKLAERQERVLTLSIENRLKELQRIKPELEQLLAKIESLIDILVQPDYNDLNSLDFDKQISPDQNKPQHHGIANMSQNVEVQFSPYIEIDQKSFDKDVLQNLKDLKRELIEGKLTKLICIEKVLSRRSEQFVSSIRDIVELKGRATNIILKLGELKIVNELDEGHKRSSTLDQANDSPDESSDFEEVAPKDDLELYIPKSLRKDYGLEPIDPREQDISTSVSLTDESFDSGISAGPSRYQEPETIHTCNARLDSGRLCPRRDKVKCPFHGKIVPRDSLGDIIDEKDRLDEEKRIAKEKSRVPDWQDPQLLADIQAATGINLKMPTKGRTGSSSRSKLMNAKTCDVTPKQRLQKRLQKLRK